MTPIICHKGVAAPLLRINIDTDAIIPSREMKGVSKKGLGEGLFAVWRYSNADARTNNPDFVLNKPDYANTTILLGGDNFGCGSSREHAVWALAEYGIKAIISPGFGSIFYQNCVRNGIVPVVLSNETVITLAAWVEANPQTNQLVVDLENQKVVANDGNEYAFTIEASHQEMLIKGLDAIGMTLQLESQIAAFEQAYNAKRTWLSSTETAIPNQAL